MQVEELFPYQKEGVDWLINKRFALLADEMGLGKTVQVVKACDTLELRRILVICPAVARVNWEREFTKWSCFKRTYSTLLSLNTEPALKGVVIVSFDYTTYNAAKLQQPWDLVVIDETHFLKSRDTKRSVTIFGKGGLVHFSKRVWALSGTPAPNHAGELWIILYIFGATLLKYGEFVSTFCDTLQTNFGMRITGTKMKAVPELKQMLSKIMLRRKKMDVLKQLPAISYTDFTVEPCDVDLHIQATFIHFVFPIDRTNELKRALDVQTRALESFVEVTEHVKGANTDRVKTLEGLANSVATLRRYSGLQKVKAVTELISSELDAGLYKKIVLFCVHRDVIEGLRTSLSKYGVVTLYGGTDPGTKMRNVDKFQTRIKPRVFIGNIAAAGTNITLTAAHHVTFVEQDFVPGNNAQAAMRVHRIGQKDPVTVRFISLNNPMDQKITHILKKKTKELTEIFDT